MSSPLAGRRNGGGRSPSSERGPRKRGRRRRRGRRSSPPDATTTVFAAAAAAASVLLLGRASPDGLAFAAAADVATAAAPPDEEGLRPTAAETALPVERGDGGDADSEEGGGVRYEPDLGGVEHKTATGERCHWGTAGCHAESPGAASAVKPKAEGGGEAAAAKAGAFVPKKAAPGREQRRAGLSVDDGDAKRRNASEASSAQRQKDASSFTVDKLDRDEASGEAVHRPPDGFVLSAHVVADPSDGLSYFVDTSSAEGDDVPEELIVPFLECGAVGSATERFPVRSGSFRHFPSGSDPTAWSTAGGGGGGGGGRDNGSTTPTGSSDDLHAHGNPQLVVALRPLELTVSGNGGESRTFDAGDVILLGDTLGKGHKMRAARDGRADDLGVFVLNLPHHHHHHHHHHAAPSAQTSSGEHLSILGLRRPRGAAQTRPSSAASEEGRGGPLRWGRPSPCKLEHDPAYSTLGVQSPTQHRGGPAAVPFPPVLSALGLSSPRRIVLAAIGAAASSFLTYFVYRVAPPVLGLLGVLGLAAGGTAVIDGTAGFILEEWRAWGELRRARMDEEEDDEGGGAEDSVGRGERVGGDEEEGASNVRLEEEDGDEIDASE